MTVDLVCAGCGTPFKRLKRQVDSAIRQAKGKPVNFYCEQVCVRKFGKSYGPSSKSEQQDAYIRDNWEKMSDLQLAAALDLKAGTVAERRYGLGLRRQRHPPK